MPLPKIPAALGVSTGYAPDLTKPPGLTGLGATYANIADAPGIEGLSSGFRFNTLLALALTNGILPLVAPLTVTIATAGQGTETYLYNSGEFVLQRQFTSGALVTITTSGSAYLTCSSSFTPTDGSVLAVAFAVTYPNNLNAYRRRRYL